jgi:YD repeat-containing protein
VNFIGQGPSFDSGAVMVKNNSSQAFTIDNVSVDIAGIHYDLWGSGLTVPGNGSLILAQSDGQLQNFDTSDAAGITCTPSYVTPAITLTIGGIYAQFNDTSQILNTGGIDLATCPANTNESHQWLQVYGGGGATSQGGPNPTVKPTTCTGAEPVDCDTGEFWQNIDDLAVPGRGVSLDFNRTYSSLAASQDGPLGFGWTDSYNMSLSIDPNSGIVTIRQENGSSVSAPPCQAGLGLCPSTGYQFPTFVEALLANNGDGTYTFNHKDGEKFVFSAASGQLLREVDRNGYATTLSYANGQLASVTDHAGRSLTLGYGANGQLASVTDPIGRQVSYGYDAQGNLVSVKDLGQGTTSFTYDPNHLMLTMTDPKHGVLTNVYDASGRVTSQTDAMHRTTSWSYGLGTTTITDPAGHVSLQQYDNHKLVSVTSGYGTPQAATWSYTYDLATLGIATITDPNHNVTHNTWDPEGNLLTTTDAMNRTAAYTYNAFSEPLTTTDPLKVTTTNVYLRHEVAQFE